MRQSGVAVPGGVEHDGLRARAVHEVGNWLVVTDCSNAFNTVNGTAGLEEAINHVPAPFVVTCFGARPADVLFRMDPGETRTIVCSSGVQQEDTMGLVLFYLVLRPGLKRCREEFEGKWVEAFA